MTGNNIVASIRRIRDGITQSINHGICKGITTSLFALLILTHSISAYSQPSEESIYQAQRMYIAYFGRPGLPDGLEYWANRFDEGGNIQTIAEKFGSSAEYFNKNTPTYNWGLIGDLYRQMFSRDPESAGLLYFYRLLSAGTVSFESIALEIADAAVNEDLLALENKILVANEFSSLIPIDGDEYIDIDGITELLSSVTSDPETVDNALDQLTDFILDPSFKPDYRILFSGGTDGITDCTDNYCVSPGKSLEFIQSQEQYENAVAAYSGGLYEAQNIDFQNNFVLLYDAGVGQNPVKVLSIENQERAIRLNLEILSVCIGFNDPTPIIIEDVAVSASVSSASTSATSPYKKHWYVLIEINRFNLDDIDSSDIFFLYSQKPILINETMGECG